jgi:hypothetical protein
VVDTLKTVALLLYEWDSRFHFLITGGQGFLLLFQESRVKNIAVNISVSSIEVIGELNGTLRSDAR